MTLCYEGIKHPSLNILLDNQRSRNCPGNAWKWGFCPQTFWFESLLFERV